jgi:hypothetical protein
MIFLLFEMIGRMVPLEMRRHRPDGEGRTQAMPACGGSRGLSKPTGWWIEKALNLPAAARASLSP